MLSNTTQFSLLSQQTKNKQIGSCRYTFSSNHKINKSLCGLCFWAPDRPVSFGTNPQNPKLTNPKQFWAKLLDPKPKN